MTCSPTRLTRPDSLNGSRVSPAGTWATARPLSGRRAPPPPPPPAGPAAEAVSPSAPAPPRFSKGQRGVPGGHRAAGTPAVGTRCHTARRIGGADRPSVSEVTHIDPPTSWQL